MSDPIIKIENMNKWFGDFQVLKNIDLSVEKNKKIVVCGPSGSGKSTLIRCINRLEEHQEGTITVDGTELSENTKNIEAIRAEVGMVFQQFNLFPHLSILDNCTLAPIWVKKMPKAKAEELALEHLNRVQISDQAQKFPGQLSGGQKKLLELGRTMMVDAKLVLLDEVGAGVNRTLLKDLGTAIQRLNKEKGYTFCMIEHDIDFISRMCDPVIVMSEGSVLFEGTSDEVKKNDKVIDSYLGRRNQKIKDAQ